MLKDKFSGADGRRRLVQSLRDQPIVEHDDALATEIAARGELLEFAPSVSLVTQGHHDSDIYFLIVGEATVYVNGRPIATRIAGQSIGEMAALSPSAPRSATVITAKPTLTVRLTEPEFQKIAQSFPKVWRPIGMVVAERLRQRERFHGSPRATPILFIGSSVEGLPVAEQIVSGLKHDNIIPRVWNTPGLFSPGGVSIDVLLKEVDNSDFAAFVFGPDDKIASRGKSYQGPRDNVVFELGLFMGRLERTRAFLVKEHSSDIKIPSDLLGVTSITYVLKPGQTLADAIAPVCNDLRVAAKNNGPR